MKFKRDASVSRKRSYFHSQVKKKETPTGERKEKEMKKKKRKRKERSPEEPGHWQKAYACPCSGHNHRTWRDGRAGW